MTRNYNLTAEEVWDQRAELGQIESNQWDHLYIHTYADSIYQNCDEDCNCAYETFTDKKEWLAMYDDHKFRVID